MFTLSVEPKIACKHTDGVQLSADATVARQHATLNLNARRKAGLETNTVAIMLDGKMIDCFDGKRWDSEIDHAYP